VQGGKSTDTVRTRLNMNIANLMKTDPSIKNERFSLPPHLHTQTSTTLSSPHSHLPHTPSHAPIRTCSHKLRAHAPRTPSCLRHLSSCSRWIVIPVFIQKLFRAWLVRWVFGPGDGGDLFAAGVFVWEGDTGSHVQVKRWGWDGEVRLFVVVECKICWWVVSSDVSFVCTRS
jgi:hypothetical protein